MIRLVNNNVNKQMAFNRNCTKGRNWKSVVMWVLRVCPLFRLSYFESLWCGELQFLIVNINSLFMDNVATFHAMRSLFHDPKVRAINF